MIGHELIRDLETEIYYLGQEVKELKEENKRLQVELEMTYEQRGHRVD